MRLDSPLFFFTRMNSQEEKETQMVSPCSFYRFDPISIPSKPSITERMRNAGYLLWKKTLEKISPYSLEYQYRSAMESATTYKEWAEAAMKLDELQGLNQWKLDPVSPDYDYELIQNRLSQLRKAREKGDLGSMMFAIRTSLTRKLGDMGNPSLYEHAHIGTKKLIEDYINEVVETLNIVCDLECDEFTTTQKYEIFTNIRMSFGRTALLLSGGAALVMHHIGVIKCLYENDLLPRIISGSSGGGIIAAIVASKPKEEIPTSFEQVLNYNFTAFDRDDQPESVFYRLSRFVKQGVLFDTQFLIECLKENIGEITFQEAFNRTSCVLNITVSSGTVYEMPRLLNYLTAPNVLIWSAVAASCAVPLLFQPSTIWAKDKNGKVVPWNPGDQRWIDGTIEGDLPMNKLAELFGVNHFIVCQVNPYVIPFIQPRFVTSTFDKYAGLALKLARSELEHRLYQLLELGVMPSLLKRAQDIVSQRYSGDITILPDIPYADFLKIAENPSRQFLMNAFIRGDKATRPKISIIQNHCKIELTIDSILHRLRRKRLSEERSLHSQASLSESQALTASSLASKSAPTTPKQEQFSYIPPPHVHPQNGRRKDGVVTPPHASAPSLLPPPPLHPIFNENGGKAVNFELHLTPPPSFKSVVKVEGANGGVSTAGTSSSKKSKGKGLRNIYMTQLEELSEGGHPRRKGGSVEWAAEMYVEECPKKETVFNQWLGVKEERRLPRRNRSSPELFSLESDFV
ncbi:uncharacterized protein VTP21DRAFT_2230 [Calcarisporiella thermophila]|uniref:uncharacterized protein n=1 Tax=Calcarisporiella thermophila TaxID=911321 RepID=UPI003744136C